MVDVFEIKMCNYCKNTECEKRITVNNDGGLIMYKCEEYIKNDSKIVPFEKPVIITAKRKYFDYYET